MTIPLYRDLPSRGSIAAVSAWASERPACALFEGLAGAADAALVADLFTASGGCVLVCVDGAKKAESLVEEVRTFVPPEQVRLFPSRDAVPYNLKSPFGPTTEARLALLSHLLAGRRAVVVAPHAALLQRVPPPRRLYNDIVRLRAGSPLSIEQLRTWLQEIGFRRESRVEDVGTYAVRGGIVDIYPYDCEHPLRCEFYGETLESLRAFDVFSQKSLAPLESADLLPLREFCLRPEQLSAGIEAMARHASHGGAEEATVRTLEHQWLRTADLEGVEWYLHWFGVESASLCEYLPPGAVVVWDDALDPPRRFEETLENYRRHQERVPPALRSSLSPPAELLLAPAAVQQMLELYARVLVQTRPVPQGARTFDCGLRPQPATGGNIDAFAADCAERLAAGAQVCVLSPTPGHAERLLELLGDRCAGLRPAVGLLREGFVDRDGSRAVFTDQQLFPHQPPRQGRGRRYGGGEAIRSFEELAPGDVVVHVDHGIGRFVGIERVSVGTAKQDCMVLQYKESARLYVPVEDFHRVQKYVGREGHAPELSTLGSGAWERAKQRTRSSLAQMAQDLVELYAKRQYLEGIAFAPDTVWQKEFEEAFLYEETADQHRAIREVKADMEARKPMDRLVCGDVGFGKTEVAMRAAFKAVMSGHQVALLAPTTVLAAQHYETLRERMAGFPLRIAMLSRFLKPPQQREVVQRLASGGVDIVVGTHRLLATDCAFKNLGLLIIDEEQRFGVRHKERLKQYRFQVDVLSLTATPIPRTLHMSLVGARDLSLIATPPRNRLPIETSVAEYHDELLVRAIEEELARGGQVYLVDNRIRHLPQLRERVELLVPRARCVVAHGQMDEEELARAMREFVAGRFDVLIATTIIENGLDIPNVNTIVVNRADLLGLSQLYQLRGRVGRSAEQAYAWLLVPSFKAVSEEALRRLRVLEQYTDLGSGFQIAMRDLEIRGAGEILGTMQHGSIAAVGFELYCRLLKEAIDEQLGRQQAVEEKPVKVDVEVDAYIPTEYVADATSRVAIYRDLADAGTMQALTDLRRSLADRFGPLPLSVEALLQLIELKLAARRAGASRAAIDRDGVLSLALDGEEAQVRAAVAALLVRDTHHFEVLYEKPLRMKTPLRADAPHDRMREAVVALGGAGA